MDNPPALFTADLRRSPRRSLEVPITLRVENARVEGTTDNLSGVGLMFFAEEPLRVTVEYVDCDGTPRVQRGNLVRTQKMTERTTGFAIEFDPE
jgi:hypothetical protein